MKKVLVIALVVLLQPQLRAEDWTTKNGKAYLNVQVISHNAAYVTILDKDGGARVPLSTLNADLQKRFGYDPAKAPAIVAATNAADQHDKEALAAEKNRVKAEEAQSLKQVSDAIASAVFAPSPDTDLPLPVTATASAIVPDSATANNVGSYGPAIETEPGTEIDDWSYGDYGGYGYGGYGYGFGYGYGHRGFSGHPMGMRGFAHR